MPQIFTRLIDAAQGKAPLSAKRSGAWPAARRAHLDLHPSCAVCGSLEKLEVHHIRPFHLHPELELDPKNFVTLCESRGYANCHLFFGHLGNYRSFNVDVLSDAGQWAHKIATRPMAEAAA